MLKLNNTHPQWIRNKTMPSGALELNCRKNENKTNQTQTQCFALFKNQRVRVKAAILPESCAGHGAVITQQSRPNLHSEQQRKKNQTESRLSCQGIAQPFKVKHSRPVGVDESIFQGEGHGLRCLNQKSEKNRVRKQTKKQQDPNRRENTRWVVGEVDGAGNKDTLEMIVKDT